MIGRIGRSQQSLELAPANLLVTQKTHKNGGRFLDSTSLPTSAVLASTFYRRCDITRSCDMMLVTPFEHAARAPVPARTGPGLLKYRIGYRRTASKPPCEYRTRPCSRYSRAAVSWSARLSAIAVRWSRFGLILFFNTLYI